MKLTHLLSASSGVAALGFLLASPVVSAAVADYAGSYEALLVSGASESARPLGKFELTVAKNGTFSAKVTAKEAKTFTFTGSIEEVDGVAVIKPAKGKTERLVQIVRGKSIPNYVVGFSVDDGVLSAQVSSDSISASADDGVRVKTFAGKDTADWKGTYTMALAAPEKLDDALDTTTPDGSGYATLTVSAKGVLSYTGKLADGTTITGSLAPGQARDYRLFLNPYKTLDSYLAGNLAIVPASSGGFTGGGDIELFWRKSPAAKPAVFTGGFGPVGVSARIAAWTAPAKNQTLAQLLGVEDKQFSFGVFGDSSLAQAYPGRVPVRLSLDKAGNLVPVYGDSLAPKTAKEWAKIWSGKVDAKTGKFTATLNVVDFVAGAKATGNSNAGGDRYTSAKIVKRTLKFEGVLMRTPAADVGLESVSLEEALFKILGYYELLAAGGVTTTLYGGIEGADEVETVGVGAPTPNDIAPGTPGNYRFTVKTEAAVTLADIPTGQTGFSLISQDSVPTPFTNGGTLNFNISADLTVLTFNGRRVSLAGDSRTRGATTPGPLAGGNLVYADTTKPGAKTPKRDNMVVVFYLNESGVVTGVQVSNVFILPAKWRIKVPAMTVTLPGGQKFTTPAINQVVSAFSVAFYTYTDLADPVKIP